MGLGHKRKGGLGLSNSSKKNAAKAAEVEMARERAVSVKKSENDAREDSPGRVLL